MKWMLEAMWKGELNDELTFDRKWRYEQRRFWIGCSCSCAAVGKGETKIARACSTRPG